MLLTPAERKQYERLYARYMEKVVANPFIFHEPTEKQAEFLMAPEREALYGGAAGGGKSDTLLMDALQDVDQPTFSAVIFRKTYRDLTESDAIADRAMKWAAIWRDKGLPVKWHGGDFALLFGSGAKIAFRHLQHENDKYNYQGAAYQAIYFDELTQFTQTQYRYLFSRLRRARGSRIPLRMRAGSNPGGVGHMWVKNRFIDGYSKNRIFVPAKLSDNPHLEEDYMQSLAELDPITRAQLLNGDWTARMVGGKFRREWFDMRRSQRAPNGTRWVRFWDMAATEKKAGNDPDWTSGSLLGEFDGDYFLANIAMFRGTPKATENFIKRTAKLDGYDVPQRMEQEGGSGGPTTIDHYARTVFNGWDFLGVKATEIGNDEIRANPLSSVAERGHLWLVGNGTWIEPFLDQADAFPHGDHDDFISSTAGALHVLRKEGEVKIDESLAGAADPWEDTDVVDDLYTRDWDF